MRLPSRFECLFRSLPDGRRVYYSRAWRGPGVLLRDAAQEAELRRALRTGFRVLLPLMLLGLLLFLAPSAFHTPLLQRMGKAAALVLLTLVIIGVAVLEWRSDRLLKDCPGIAERLTQRDFETCLAMRLSVGGLKLRVFVLVLLGGASLGLGLFYGLHADLLRAVPPVLFAAVPPLLLRQWLRFLKYKRTAG
jgi:hypothetical protein